MIRKTPIRAMSLFLLILTLCASLAPCALADVPSVPIAANVDAVCVINAELREVVVDQNAHTRVYPTSTVKLMTALVAAEHFSDLEKRITVTKEMLTLVTGRNMGLAVGETIRVTDLIHALLCGGYNDAAVILALATSGSNDAFCDEMNAKAKALGANNTCYTNPTGLHDPSMYTTAYDTALIGLAVLENDTIFEASKRVKYVIPATNMSDERTIYNRNALITTSMTEEYYYSYAEGMNAGATDEGGDCVVTAGKLDGLTWVCAVMGGRLTSEDDETNHAYVAAKQMLRHALVSYEVKVLRTTKEKLGTIPIRFSATEESVPYRMSKDLSALLNIAVDPARDVEYEITINYELMEAPIQEGTVVGSIRAVYQGAVLDSADLITSETIESHGFLVFMYKVKLVTQHPIFILFVLVTIGGIVFYVWKKHPSPNSKRDRRKRNRYF